MSVPPAAHWAQHAMVQRPELKGTRTGKQAGSPTQQRSQASLPPSTSTPACWMCARTCTSYGWAVQEAHATVSRISFFPASHVTFCTVCARALGAAPGTALADVVAGCHATPTSRLRSPAFVAFLREWKMLLEVVYMNRQFVVTTSAAGQNQVGFVPSALHQLAGCLSESLADRDGLTLKEVHMLMQEAAAVNAQRGRCRDDCPTNLDHSDASLQRRDLSVGGPSQFPSAASTVAADVGTPNETPRHDNDLVQRLLGIVDDLCTHDRMRVDERMHWQNDQQEHERQVVSLRAENDALKARLALRDRECDALMTQNAKLTQKIATSDVPSTLIGHMMAMSAAVDMFTGLASDLAFLKTRLFTEEAVAMVREAAASAQRARRLKADLDASQLHLRQQQKMLDASRRAVMEAWSEGAEAPSHARGATSLAPHLAALRPRVAAFDTSAAAESTVF